MENNNRTLKILHTSDWHLGRSLYDRKRYDEFENFLNWLAEFIRTESIDLLLVSGDIFDTTTPGNRAQELYYGFLNKASRSGCRHVVVTGGNHDSPTFLNAPKELLLFFNVYVVGAMTENPEDEILVLNDKSGVPKAIICAVPYLRDKDIRTVAEGEKMEDKNLKLLAGIAAHYDAIGNAALGKRGENNSIPIIGMGHLFTTGGKVTEGDGVRELYVGGAACVSENSFPVCFDYLALGHLHSPQKVGNSAHKRYCGSPIPMGFGEANQAKSVTVIEFLGNMPTITEHEIPRFQELKSISGNAEEIKAEIERLKAAQSNAWLEIIYTGTEHSAGLNELLDEAVAGSAMEILRIKVKRITEYALSRSNEHETLDDLDVNDVFEKCLDAHCMEEPDRSELMSTYREVVSALVEVDINAE